LLRVLDSIGYSIQELAPSSLPGEPIDHRSEAVMFLLGANAARDAVTAWLDHTGALPSLAMFVTGEGQWDQAISKRCCDIAAWPCTAEELSYRLTRLRSDCRINPPALDPALADTLLDLNLIGRSPAFVEAVGDLRRMAQCNAPVVISGETGTGKELVARAIHYLGPRAGGPFVPVNCGALPDHLVENELFGHARGAYTDATASSVGAVGEANGGTLFLDEVEALSPRAQVSLLRFLQDNAYRPLGGRGTRQANVRVISAGNADLCTLCDRGELRSDLYYRLQVLSIELPPLRERADDVELLAGHFIDRYCRQYGIQRKVLDGQSLQRLRGYPWPGNVRELENLIHREVLGAAGAILHLAPERGHSYTSAVADGEPEARERKCFAEAKASAIKRFERDYLVDLLAEAGGNVSRAARIAGKERRALGKLLKKHGIQTQFAS
jgi:DNA-binding NtrC family response regulator